MLALGHFGRLNTDQKADSFQLDNLSLGVKYRPHLYAILLALGSLARYFPPWWRREIDAAFRREALPANSAHTKIVPAELGERLQDLSAIAAWAYRQRPAG